VGMGLIFNTVSLFNWNVRMINDYSQCTRLALCTSGAT